MLIVITPDVSWVRSLFEAMPPDIDVYFINAHNLRERWRWSAYPWKTIGRWNQVGKNTEQVNLNLPIVLRRFARFIVWRFILNAIKRSKLKNRNNEKASRLRPTVIYTYPWHATFLKNVSGVQMAYLAHDPFVFYQCWKPEITFKQELQLLNSCDHIFAITDDLASDFKRIIKSDAQISVARNGVDSIRVAETRPARPVDLPVGRPVIGCVGQINDTFDWGWIERLVGKNPSYQFIFIGNLVEVNPLLASLIERRLRDGKILWLGGRPHDQLSAYISNFDVCLCPLRKNDHNDRRCPLRFFDYFAGGRPILTTPISEAFAHERFVHIAETVNEATAILEGLASGSIAHDEQAMLSYAAQNTWTVRAKQFLAELNSTVAP